RFSITLGLSNLEPRFQPSSGFIHSIAVQEHLSRDEILRQIVRIGAPQTLKCRQCLIHCTLLLEFKGIGIAGERVRLALSNQLFEIGNAFVHVSNSKYSATILLGP